MSATEQKKLLLQAKVACYLKLKTFEDRQAQDGTLSENMCMPIWDEVLCWDPAPIRTTASQSCPDYINGFNKHENATKYCTENGTWFVIPTFNHSWTNFTSCSKSSIDLKFHIENAARLRLMYSIGYSVSLAALVIAVVIMLCCRRMHSKSNTLHISLFISFILRASVSFLKDLLFKGVGLNMDVSQKEDGTYEFLDGPHWQCKFLFVIFNYSITASIMWIFVEGLYLHVLLYRPLATESKGVRMYIILGWVLPIVLLIPWVTVKALYEDTFCWNFQDNPQYFWILKGPGVAIVIINFISFIDVSRILCTRARHTKTTVGKDKYKKLAKFILVLIPLFGVTYIVFFIAFPAGMNGKDFNVTHLYIEMAYNSFQGVVLAILFCFLNGEVHSELKRMWSRHQTRRIDMASFNKSFGSSFKIKSPTIFGRRHDRSQFLKQGSSSSSDNGNANELLKKTLLTRALNVISRHDSVHGDGVKETVPLPADRHKANNSNHIMQQTDGNIEIM